MIVPCTPHPGLGTLIVRQQQIDLATCRASPVHIAPAASRPRVVVVRHGDSGTQSIVWHGRTALTVHERYKGFPAGSPGPIEIQGTSPDGRWILYSIDPMGSASLGADGLTVKAVAVNGGRSYTVSSGLTYASYRSWCDFFTLVVTAGGDRIANHDKRLIVTGPPAWKPHPLVREPGRTFGSVACAPDGNSVVVQEEPKGGANESSTKSHWQLWRIGLDGKSSKLTSPPAGSSDDSPQFSPDESTLYFVRSKADQGVLYALRDGKLVGPLLALGRVDGYYGHHDWPYRVRR